MISYWSIFIIIVSIVLIFSLLILLYRPVPVKYLIKNVYPNAEYTPNKNAIRKENYTLYTRSAARSLPNDNLILIFIGGILLQSDIVKTYGICNYLDNSVGDKYDILVFNYPVRFKYTMQQTLIAINETLKEFIHYKRVHVIGLSIGCLLAGAFYNKERNDVIAKQMGIPRIGMQFTTFTGFCGLYETTFSSNLLTQLFKFYISRGTPAANNYTCYSLVDIPKLIVSSESDFLISQTIKYCQRIPVDKVKVYNSKTLPHCFQQYLNLYEARESLDLFITFILDHDSK